MGTMLGWHADVSGLPGTGVRIVVSDRDRPVTVKSMLDALQADPELGTWFGSCLAALPWRAFYWECPALTAATLLDPFECVALEAPSLIGQVAEPHAFRNHLAAAPPGALVATFPNLSGDAVLIVSTEMGDGRGYPHLGAFLRAAPPGQIAAFFSAVASQALRLCGEQPVWVSTAGDGVAWLHARLDRRPKYYHYAPYRTVKRSKPIPPQGSRHP